MKTAMRLTAGAGVVLAALLGATAARGEEVFSPRGYCRTTGGEVVETGDPAVYVCCYPDRQRCIEVDERSQTSRRAGRPETFASASARAMPVTKTQPGR
jgi:hypothetical protein